MFNLLVLLIPLCLSLRGVAAAEDWWDHFAGNLATDLAPFISLFGEAPTKQFLSESLTALDYFIFAMAPIGILTAVVSAIRVRGGASLRAFIGRAQEGMGLIEAELCSSTSRDVCELYNNGGIARTMGQPRILEVIHDPKASDDEFFDGVDGKATAGIYPAQQYLQDMCVGKPEVDNGPVALGSWEEVVPRLGGFWGYRRKHGQMQNNQESQPLAGETAHFAPYPNLTLNLWMRKRSTLSLLASASVGAALQSGVVVYAAIATYVLRLETNNTGPPGYGFPLMAVGTLALCTGIFLCAFLVGESTAERTFCRNDAANKSGDGGKKELSKLVWMQPGGQRIGDQTFDAFAYSDGNAALDKYTTSWKVMDALNDLHEHSSVLSPTADYMEPRERKELMLYSAVTLSTAGFISQFIGLRSLHSSISILHLGAMLVMSGLRSLLRSQRMDAENNLLVAAPDVLRGHELDWLALHLARPDIDKLDAHSSTSRPLGRSQLRAGPAESNASTGHGNFELDQLSSDQGSPDVNSLAGPNSMRPTLRFGRPLWIVSGRPLDSGDTDRTTHGQHSSSILLLQEDLGWDRYRARLENSTAETFEICGSTKEPFPQVERLFMKTCSATLARKIFMMRKRLAELTGPNVSSVLLPASMRNWPAETTVVREIASHLAKAIPQAADLLFSKASKLPGEWKNALSFHWRLQCVTVGHRYHFAPIYLKIWRKSVTGQWETDGDSFEAVVGLLTWSIQEHPHTNSTSMGTPLTCRIISAGPSCEQSRPLGLQLWLGPDGMENLRIQDALFEFPEKENAESRHSVTYSPRDIFIKEPNSLYFRHAVQPRPGDLDNDSMALRLFGWNNKDLKLSKTLPVSFSLTALPLQDLCAQEVFASFIHAFFCVADDIGTIKFKTTSDGQLEGLENSQLSKIFDVFERNNVGTRQDAMLTILPGIGLDRLCKSGLRTAIKTAHRQAREFRQDERWADASAVVWRMWKFLRPIRIDLAWHEYHHFYVSALLLVLEHERLQMLNDLVSDGVIKTTIATVGLLTACSNLETDFYCTKDRTPRQLIGCFRRAATKLSSITHTVEGLRELWASEMGGWNKLEPMKVTDQNVGEIARGWRMFPSQPFFIDEYISANLLWLGHPASDLSVEQLTVNLIRAAQGGDVWRSWDLNYVDIVSDKPTLLPTKLPCGLEDTVWRFMLETLIELGADPNADDSAFGGPGRTAISYAAERGATQGVEALLEGGADPNIADTMDGKTALHYAAIRGDCDLVRMLVCADNIHLSARDARNITPWVYALLLQRDMANKVMIDYGVNLQDELGYLPFANLDDILTNEEVPPSSRVSHEGVARRLLDAMNRRLTVNVGRFVRATIQEGRLELGRLLLNNKSFNVPDELFKNGSSNNSRGFFAEAAAHGRFEFLKLLLRKAEERNITLSKRERQEVLAIAVTLGRQWEVVEFLLNDPRTCPDDIDFVVAEHPHEFPYRNITPTGHPVTRGRRNTARSLLQTGKVDYEGETLLMVAVSRNQLSMAQLLLRYGDVRAGINLESPSAWTALTLAAERDNPQMIKLLLEVEGIDVNRISSVGLNALMMSADKGHASAVDVLLQANGIDVNKANKDGETAVVFARRCGHRGIVQLLLDKGATIPDQFALEFERDGFDILPDMAERVREV